jgi:hypothetical protein
MSALIDEENYYDFCGCADPASFIDELLRLYSLGSAEKIERELFPQFSDLKYLKGFVGVLIDYFNRYRISGVERPIDNPYLLQKVELVKYCLKFLTIDWEQVGNRGKYICLYSFIYTYLQIPDINGYPYVVMQFLENTRAHNIFPQLENYKFIEHGSGIRCAWINSDLHIEEVKDLTQDIDEEDIKRVMNL